MRARLVGALTVVAIGCGAMLLNAKPPMTASVEVAPSPVKTGAVLGVTSSLTNNTKNAQSVSVTVEMRGPCGVSVRRGYNVMVNGGQRTCRKPCFKRQPVRVTTKRP